MKTYSKALATIVATLLTALPLIPVNASEGDRYQFAVSSDQERQARSKRYRYEVATGLCISLTQEGEVDAADQFCKAALQIAQREADRVRTHSRPAALSNINPEGQRLALALNNRGVHAAMAGDTPSAHAWFLKAMELDPRLRQASSNAALAGRSLVAASR